MRAAREWHGRHIERLERAEYERLKAKYEPSLQAIEARSDETPRGSAVGESVVGNADAAKD